MKERGIYTKKVMKCFMHPHNLGKIKNADGIGKVGNKICGDIMWLYIKVKDNKITDIKFETFGCVAAIATSTMITDLAKGKTIEDALKISREDVIKSLGSLPSVKIHCSVLATDALYEAIYDYLSKNKLPVPEKLLKRHKEIQQELKTVEKKHPKFVKMEEKTKR